MWAALGWDKPCTAHKILEWTPDFSTIEIMGTSPSSPPELYATPLTAELAGLSSVESLEVVDGLIDLSGGLGKADGARGALELLDQLEATKLPEADVAVLEYCHANALSILQRHEATNT